MTIELRVHCTFQIDINDKRQFIVVLSGKLREIWDGRYEAKNVFFFIFRSFARSFFDNVDNVKSKNTFA